MKIFYWSMRSLRFLKRISFLTEVNTNSMFLESTAVVKWWYSLVSLDL